MRLQIKRVKFVVLQQASRNVLGLFFKQTLVQWRGFLEHYGLADSIPAY